MKTFLATTTVLLLTSLSAYAGIRDVGNGGDICENQFKIVRDDIAKWIQAGGANGLSLPTNTSATEYSQRMMEALSKAKVSCTDERLYVDGSEKTCINTSGRLAGPKIVCNNQRFLQTSEENRFVLVHHEYAGLAGYEVNNGSESDYRISNQITGFLTEQTVKRLAVKAAPKPIGGRATSCEPTALQHQQAIKKVINIIRAKLATKLQRNGTEIARVEFDASKTDLRNGSEQIKLDDESIVFITTKGTKLTLHTYANSFYINFGVVDLDSEGYYKTCASKVNEFYFLNLVNPVTYYGIFEKDAVFTKQSHTEGDFFNIFDEKNPEYLFQYPAH